MKRLIRNLLGKMGYVLVRRNALLDVNGVPVDMQDEDFINAFKNCKDQSFTSVEPLFALNLSVKYIIKNKIAGDFVECGVWRGGSAMMMAYTLKSLGVTDRKIFLYDTFEGMSEPTEKDADYRNRSASALLNSSDKLEGKNIWCYSPLEEVMENLKRTGYPMENFVLIKGKVEETIPGQVPKQIALLRLDTDWYDSTKHELEHLYPLLMHNGVLVIDDYGHWKGARRACDEYFSKHNIRLMLQRVDYSVRLAVKTS